ncbi:ferritin [Cellulophaga sp. F20128]|uniref:ferritin n=1 Tax=Cellulophaga sp. F20128 TaxID=2926413 RepID=UPI001FF3959E|nr:ferritin [Cellulophaga sp. F20128]MCK0156551.1 ferritin [Cellulophaga sp. F20128]
MKTKRISSAMEKMLNEQMTREAYQAQVYLSFGCWAEENSFVGVSEFLYRHMQEEREHMFKFVKYILDRGGSISIDTIKAAPKAPKDIGDCLEKILKHEIDNSKEIDKIVNLAHKEKDWATFSFGQWFVKEQIEEETLINELIDKYTLASKEVTDNVNLYEMDKDLASASQHATIPREEKL